VLEANPDYKGKDTPKFKQIVGRIIPEPKTALLAYLANEIALTEVDPTSEGELKKNPDGVVKKIDGIDYQWIGINVEKAPLNDLKVRQAIRYGIDVDAIITGAYNNTVPRADNLLAPGLLGYWKDTPVYKHDPDKAKALLAEAGYKDKPYPIKMVYYEVDPLAVAAQKQLVKGMEEAGFEVNDIAVQDDPYNIWTNPDDKLNKTLNLRGVNWCSDWPSGLTMLPPLLRTGATYNTEQFSEKSIDDEMDAIVEKPLEEQADAWGALDEKIGTEFFPIIPTAFRNDLFVFGSKIGNGTGDGIIGAPYYKGMYVSQ